MMNRRGFMGAMIGTFVASQLPFYAKPARLTIARNYRLAVLCDFGTIRGPEVFTTFVHGTYHFKAEGIEVKRTLIAYNISLINPEGLIVATAPFSCGQLEALHGDILNLDYSLTISGYDGWNGTPHHNERRTFGRETQRPLLTEHDIRRLKLHENLATTQSSPRLLSDRRHADA
jgi:hypothetical protein